MSGIIEPSRSLPVIEPYDVIVCGGGPAGMGAALAAAQQGARTALIEMHGCLGGVWTAGLLTVVHDAANKRGVLAQFLAAMDEQQARRGFVCDVEATKAVLERMCMDAGVAVRLHTRVAAAFVERGRLTHVITESKSGREAWAAKVFIDTTGDGDLAARAGCGFELGEEHSGRMQPMSMLALLAGMDHDAMQPFTDRRPGSQRHEKLLAEIQRGGADPSYHRPSLVHIRDSLWMLMANHEYGVSGVDAADLTRATLHARAEIQRIVQALRSLGGVWGHLQLVATSSQIGVRDGRRIRGRYVVTAQDMFDGRRHPDAICRVTFKVDVHATEPTGGKTFAPSQALARRSKPYDIPLRALIAADVDGLLLAGRCISGDFLAHSSYRVTGNAVPMGEAAGTLAAISAQRGEPPHRVPWQAVRSKLPADL